MKIQNENTNGVGLYLTLPAASINYYKQVEACVRTSLKEERKLWKINPNNRASTGNA
jgi:hypothetical protein